MQYQDYYKSLGIDKKASKEEISKAYKKLARKYHPDVNKDSGAEDQFKKISEAYEVLKDEKKRKQYDMFGSNTNGGNASGWQDMFAQGGFGQGGFGQGNPGQGGFRQAGNSAGNFQFESNGFSDFFNSLFSNEQFNNPMQGHSKISKGQDYSGAIEVSLEEAASRASKSIRLRTEQGVKSYQVKIPAKIKNGQTIRLSGQGGKNALGGKPGDLLLKVKILSHKKFQLKENGIISHSLNLSPWEAALGTKIEVPTLYGPISLNIPAGTNSGTTFKLKSKGLPITSKSNADMLVKTKINIPKKLSEKEEELFKKLQAVSTYDPRE